MKILRLEADAFKRLKAVDITPLGNVVQITGRNAQGKTSVLDAIWAAIGGANHIQSEPIRKGATKARIKLDLGELIVTRSFTQKGSTLTVENAEGLAYKSPQRMLDDLVGALAFDPLAFTRMKARDQFDQLKTIAKVDLDLDALDGQNRGDFEKRADLNREAKALRAQIDGLPAPTPVGEALDISSLFRQHQNLVAAQNAAALAAQQRQGKERQAAAMRQELEDIKAAFAKKKAVYEEMERELQELAEATDTAEMAEQIQAINNEIQSAQQANSTRQEALRTAERRKDLETRATETEAKAEALTEGMDARTKAKQDAIAAAKVPVPGLGFGEGVVLYNGVPFDQASSAEQLRVSVAIAIAGNPKLRVIRIQDGSLLDDTSFQILADMAREHDMQCWVESVSNTNTVGIVIEDGEVLVDNQQAEAPAAAPEAPVKAQAQGRTTIPGLEPE